MRARHAMEGRSLALMGWMHRGGRLELILVWPDGSRVMIPAAWTDLEAPALPERTGTLGSLQDLLAVRRVLGGLLERVVLAERDDRSVGSGRIVSAVASGVGGEPAAGGGVVGARGRGAAPRGDGAARGVDRQDGRARAGDER